MNKIIFIFLSFLTFLTAMADDKVRGYVYDDNNEPLARAEIRWENTQKGTSSDNNGFFELERIAEHNILIISYISHTTQAINIESTDEPLKIIMKGNIELSEVLVSGKRAGLTTLRSTVVQTQRISSEELLRAACCNLAESFETNPSVDVSYSDASTGARQIKLLGLSGTYVQMLTENYPNFRGASSLYGLDYVPGAWMESIQISKGTSSVKNGYEAIAGQINVEYKKPATADKFSANLFASDAGRYEANSDAAWRLNDNLSTALFVHYSKDGTQHDGNDDGFLDMPIKEQVNLMNRWQHRVNNYVSQYGIRYLHESRIGGQATKHHNFTDPYRIDINTNRIEGFTKQAYIINPDNVESVALIVSGSYHEQQSQYDRTPYNVYQNNMYASLMYEREFTPMHSLSSGLSLNYDGFDENITQESVKINYDRREVVPGAYLQYTYNLNDKLIMLAGIRADHSSAYDFFITPRLHLKYNVFDWFHLRASAGKGFRTANILTENNFLLSSSRKISIADDLDQEEAWNTGINFSFYIPIAGKDLTLNAEWYYTNFNKQVVVDMDSDPHEISFYNLEGKSYSSSFQIEATYQFFRGFTFTGAWRYTDAKTDYRSRTGDLQRLKKPLVSNTKGLLTASYQTPLKKWQFDITGQFNGGGRMPAPDPSNPMWETNFDAFPLWNIQASKFFRKWSIYVGSENILNFTQKNPVIDAANPRGANFDGSMVWGPVHGRKIYAGLRVNIE